MKYIYADPNGVTQFDKYFEYLKSIQTKLSDSAFEFASNAAHYDLSSHSSLHDSWLEQVAIRELSNGQRHEKRQLEICIRLLGAYHDRYIILTYKQVQNYLLSSEVSPSGHGDLLIHEVRLSEKGFIIHELQFEQGQIQIECTDIQHNEENNIGS